MANIIRSSSEEDEEWLDDVHTKVENEMGEEHWETRKYEWTPFLDKMALELRNKISEDERNNRG